MIYKMNIEIEPSLCIFSSMEIFKEQMQMLYAREKYQNICTDAHSWIYTYSINKYLIQIIHSTCILLISWKLSLHCGYDIFCKKNTIYK